MAAAIPYIAMAFSAVGAVKESQAQAATAELNSMVNKQNEGIALAQGAAAAEAQSRDAQRRIGAAVASYGAAGVDVGLGSPTDVLAESARMSALDALTIKYNYKLKAQGFATQANLDDMTASNAKTSGYFKAGGALLNGYASTQGRAVPSFG